MHKKEHVSTKKQNPRADLADKTKMFGGSFQKNPWEERTDGKFTYMHLR